MFGFRDGAEYPAGLKPGDFIQTTNHFGDVYFEVKGCWPPRDGSDFWMVTYITYDKYGGEPREQRINSATQIRKVYSAEMAVPVILHRRERFHASFGQYDPIYGFAPVGTPLRRKGSW